MGNHGPWLAAGPAIDPDLRRRFDPAGLPQGGPLLRYLDGLARSDAMLQILLEGLGPRRHDALLRLLWRPCAEPAAGVSPFRLRRMGERLRTVGRRRAARAPARPAGASVAPVDSRPAASRGAPSWATERPHSARLDTGRRLRGTSNAPVEDLGQRRAGAGCQRWICKDEPSSSPAALPGSAGRPRCCWPREGAKVFIGDIDEEGGTRRQRPKGGSDGGAINYPAARPGRQSLGRRLCRGGASAGGPRGRPGQCRRLGPDPAVSRKPAGDVGPASSRST